MKITPEQEETLDNEEIVAGDNYPWGDKCPACGRPHVFEYSNGAKVCDKCDEVVFWPKAKVEK